MSYKQVSLDFETAAYSIAKFAASFKDARIAIVGRTAREAREVMAKEGILRSARSQPSAPVPEYRAAWQSLLWPNGSVAMCYSADEPDMLSGPLHHIAWTLASETWPNQEVVLNKLYFGLRLGVTESIDVRHFGWLKPDDQPATVAWIVRTPQTELDPQATEDGRRGRLINDAMLRVDTLLERSRDEESILHLTSAVSELVAVVRDLQDRLASAQALQRSMPALILGEITKRLGSVAEDTEAH